MRSHAFSAELKDVDWGSCYPTLFRTVRGKGWGTDSNKSGDGEFASSHLVRRSLKKSMEDYPLLAALFSLFFTPGLR